MLVALIFHPAGFGQLSGCDAAINGTLKGEPGNIQDNTFHSLAIDPRNELVVYAGTESSGIFKTTDGGGTWIRLRQGLQCGPQSTGYPQIFDIAINPFDSNILYASTVNGPGPANDLRYPSASAGVYKSIDGGMTCVQKVEGLTNTYSLYVLIDSNNPRRLYLGIGGVKSTFFQAPGIFYDGGIWTSENSGENWTPLTLPLGLNTNVFVDMVLRGGDQRTIYASGQLHGNDAPTAYGLVKSTDAGQTWNFVNPPGATLYSFDVYRQDPNIIYGHDNSPNRRVHKSTDGGLSWNVLPGASFFGAIRIHPIDSQILFFVGRNSLNKSTDGLLSSRTVFVDDQLTENQQMTDIKISLSNPKIVWACAKGYYLYRSRDGGETFTRLTAIRDLIYGNPRLQAAPILADSASSLTGLALINSSSQAVSVSLTALDSGGRQIAPVSGINPVTIQLPAANQWSKMTAELFGNTSLADSWLRVACDRLGISGFFLNFSPALTTMDGAALTIRPTSSLIFPELQQADLVLLNPNPVAADLTVQLLDNGGKDLAAARSFRIQPMGRLSTTAADLLGTALSDVQGYLRLSSSQPLAGAERLGSASGDAAVLSALDMELGSRQLTAPQFVMSGTFRSSLVLVNLEDAPTTVSISWVDDGGRLIGRGSAATLPPRGRFLVSEAAFFGLDPDRIAEGYLRISSSSTLITGAVLFSDTHKAQFRTALPLLVYGRGELIYPQAVQDATYFTGLAVVNTNSQQASVSVRIFDRNGNSLGQGQRVLAANARFSELLSQIDPHLVQLSSGYFTVSSDHPVLSFAVFGTHNLSAMAAIPGQPPPSP